MRDQTLTRNKRVLFSGNLKVKKDLTSKKAKRVLVFSALITLTSPIKPTVMHD